VQSKTIFVEPSEEAERPDKCVGIVYDAIVLSKVLYVLICLLWVDILASH